MNNPGITSNIDFFLIVQIKMNDFELNDRFEYKQKHMVW